MIKNIFLGLTLTLLISGCSFFNSSHEMEKNADELVSEGSSAFVSEDYRTAIKAYANLKDWYPFSRYAILAELKIADAHYQLEEYDEAILAYEDFEKMHPKNEAIPYVISQIGLCWFKQLDSFDRDHTPAINSMIQFKRLVDQFPASEYAKLGQEHIQKCRDHISAYELSVANFYMKTKKYKAALKRYEDLVANYPDSKESREALSKIPKCRKLANKI